MVRQRLGARTPCGRRRAGRASRTRRPRPSPSRARPRASPRSRRSGRRSRAWRTGWPSRRARPRTCTQSVRSKGPSWAEGSGQHVALDEVRRLQRLEARPEPAGRGKHVGVAERQDRAARLRHAEVAGVRRARAPPARRHRDGPGRGPCDLDRAVARSVVDHDHLVGLSKSWAASASSVRRQRGLGIPRRHDHARPGHARELYGVGRTSTLRRRADRPDPRLLLARGAARSGALPPRARGGTGRRGHDVVHFSSAWDAGRVRRWTGWTRFDCAAASRTATATRPTSAGESCRGSRWAGSTRSTRSAATTPLASIRAARLHPRRRTVITDLGLPNPELVGGRGRSRGPRGRARSSPASTCTAACRRPRSTAWRRTTAATTAWSCPAGSTWTSSLRRRGAGARPHDPVLGCDHRAPQGGARPARGAADRRRGRARGTAVAERARRPGRASSRTPRRRPGSARGCSAWARPTRQHERYGQGVGHLPARRRSTRSGWPWSSRSPAARPLVTTTHGAPQELVTEGVTGELCRPDDPEDLARACLRAFELARRPETVGPAGRPPSSSTGTAASPRSASASTRRLRCKALVTGAGGYVGSGLVASAGRRGLGRPRRWSAIALPTWTSSRRSPISSRTPSCWTPRARASTPSCTWRARTRSSPPRDPVSALAGTMLATERRGRGAAGGRGQAPRLHVDGPRLRRADDRRRRAHRGPAPGAARRATRSRGWPRSTWQRTLGVRRGRRGRAPADQRGRRSRGSRRSTAGRSWPTTSAGRARSTGRLELRSSGVQWRDFVALARRARDHDRGLPAGRARSCRAGTYNLGSGDAHDRSPASRSWCRTRSSAAPARGRSCRRPSPVRRAPSRTTSRWSGWPATGCDAETPLEEAVEETVRFCIEHKEALAR